MTASAPTPYPPRRQARGTNTLAILSLVFAFLLWPVGLILGIIAKSQLKTSGEEGDGLALAGIIVSSVVGVLSILIVTLAFFVAGEALDQMKHQRERALQRLEEMDRRDEELRRSLDAPIEVEAP